MNNIKKLEIWGLKKFQHITMDFNKFINILVGENECGKSTILEAINIAINQQYRNMDKCIIKDLLNIDNISTFKKNPKIDTLPCIKIEIEFNFNVDDKNSYMFFGMNNTEAKEKFGICFKCELDKTFEAELLPEILKGEIPYEYYKMSWITFQGSSYNILRKPINSIFIDTSTSDTNRSFNYFNKALFNSKYSDVEKLKARNRFRNSVDDTLAQLELEELDENKRFGINSRKIILDNIISIFDNSIPLENKGKGMENIIKTKIAMNKVKTKLDVVLLEEPENHLSNSNLLNMLNEIESKLHECQIIVTTHNNMIASRLNLNNVLWVNDNHIMSLKDVDKNIADFFIKADDNNFLQLLLAERVFLVEGATEYLLLPQFYKKATGENMKIKKVTIISCNGISYKNYLEIAQKTNKKVAVITDNDKKLKNIEDMKKFNEINTDQHIFMSQNINDWTWEASLYNSNSDKLNEFIKVQDGAEYKFHGENYGLKLGKMLNNKVQIAYELLNSNVDLEAPDYITEAIKWIRE